MRPLRPAHGATGGALVISTACADRPTLVRGTGGAGCMATSLGTGFASPPGSLELAFVGSQLRTRDARVPRSHYRPLPALTLSASRCPSRVQRLARRDHGDGSRA